MGIAASQGRRDRASTMWTRPLQVLTSACAIVFTTGTILWGLIMATTNAVERSMRLSGMSAAEAADAASGSFAIVGLVSGVVYIIGNALGILALKGWNWVFWVAVVINLTQGLGAALGMVPPAVFHVVADEYGFVGTLPSRITDWGGLVLAIILIASFAIFRTPWARRRPQPPGPTV